ncbi:MAG: MFS transporter [Candidatus Berkiella sp.]
MAKFLTILLIQILCGMEMDLFIPSFPELRKVFSLTPAMVQLTLSVNFAALCICSLFAGALGDRFNRKHVLLTGLVIFVLGSVTCIFAQNFTWLLIGRFLQGAGISAPAILSFAVLLDDLPNNKQASMMGLINGSKTIAMAIAPVIGSFVNLYFSWRGNFCILLGLGTVCLVASFWAVPSKPGNHLVSLSLKAFKPLLQSVDYLGLAFGISLLTAAYWLFMGMAPIFYMENMGVTLKQFGFYQGSLSLSFAIVCILSPMLLKQWGQTRLLYLGIFICFMLAFFISALALINVKGPIIITSVLVAFSMAIVFPINILYPLLLVLVPHTKGRAAGLGQAILLMLSAFTLEVVAYFYHGEFLPIGAMMFVCVTLATFFFYRFIKKQHQAVLG